MYGTIFKNIDSEIKAYSLGLIFADGTIKTNSSIFLQEDDLELIEKMFEYFNTGNKLLFVPPVKNRFSDKGRYGFHFGQESINLRNLISEDKSNLPVLSDELFKHFLRGVFDGDGCISADLKSDKTTYTFTSGTFFILFNYIEHAQYCMDFIIRMTGVNKTKIITRYGLGDVPIYQIRWSGIKNLIKIREFLYSDAQIFMSRKFDKFNLIKVGNLSKSITKYHADRRHLHYIIKNCPVCDVQFERPKYKQSNCCSHSCAIKYRFGTKDFAVLDSNI